MNLKTILRELDKTEERVIFVLMSAALIISFTQVVTRYFFAYSFSWGEQLVRIFFVWVTLMGISLCGKYGMHISIDVIKMFLPKTVIKIIDIIASIITVFLGFFLSYLIFKIVRAQIAHPQTFTSMPWLPAWTMYIAGVLGMFGLAARTAIYGLWPLLTNRQPYAGHENDGSGTV